MIRQKKIFLKALFQLVDILSQVKSVRFSDVNEVATTADDAPAQQQQQHQPASQQQGAANDGQQPSSSPPAAAAGLSASIFRKLVAKTTRSGDDSKRPQSPSTSDNSFDATSASPLNVSDSSSIEHRQAAVVPPSQQPPKSILKPYPSHGQAAFKSPTTLNAVVKSASTTAADQQQVGTAAATPNNNNAVEGLTPLAVANVGRCPTDAPSKPSSEEGGGAYTLTTLV